MAKREDRELMRRKINCSPVLIQSWKNLYELHLRQPIHESFMTLDDLNTEFEHKGRKFEILGLTISGTCMVYERENDCFWECTRHFVQSKLERWNQEFRKIAGTTVLRAIPYPYHTLFLPPIKKNRFAPKPPEESEENINETQWLSIEEAEDEINEIITE
jgi:hypothetical protein